MPFKYHKHLSVYLEEKFFEQLGELARAEGKSINKTINDLLKIGLSKRQEATEGETSNQLKKGAAACRGDFL